MKLEHKLIKNQNRSSRSVELFPLAEELYLELENIGVIQRMKEVPQLGVIDVKRDKSKTRFDYVFLQLYFHQLICENLKADLQLTYGNEVNGSEFREGWKITYKDGNNNRKKPTIGDLQQILTIVYNIGHFYNTFVSSKAVIIYADNNEEFKKQVVEASGEERYQTVAKQLLETKNYQRLHLLNSLLILERCNQENSSVMLAQELIYAYLLGRRLPEESKLSYVFDIYKKVRNVAYISYDLQIAGVPLNIDILEQKSMVTFFRELLANYNNTSSTIGLVKSMSKLLDDTVYHKEDKVIPYHRMSVNIVNRLKRGENEEYYSLWEKKDSVLNQRSGQPKGREQKKRLKLTFRKEEREVAEDLLYSLGKINGVRVGYYDRYGGEMTVVVAMKEKWEKKEETAFRILKNVIKMLRKIEKIGSEDGRFLLAVKFFLYYLTGEREVVLKQTIHKEICVLCTKGKAKRISEIREAIKSGYGNQDQIHEAQVLCDVLEEETKNDICLSLPCSIVVLEKNITKQLCEFDGMLIFPNRKEGQVIFTEAKNKRYNPILGKNELIKKLEKLEIPYEEEQVIQQNMDAKFYYSI